MASTTQPLMFAPMAALNRYRAGTLRRRLPPDVVEKGKHLILDTLAAMVSGSRLAPGRIAISYVRTLGGKPEACVLGTRLLTSVANAALANGAKRTQALVEAIWNIERLRNTRQLRPLLCL